MGGSTYFDVNGIVGDKIPKIDLKLLPNVLDRMHQAIVSGKILACHDISEGGLITSIFEMCVGGNMGATVHFDANRPDYFLFNETAGCFVVEVENGQVAKKLFDGIPYVVLGKTQKEETLVVSNLFSVDVAQLQKAWQAPMMEIFS
jgi:phosphoribosylformylglycinamidine synthase